MTLGAGVPGDARPPGGSLPAGVPPGLRARRRPRPTAEVAETSQESGARRLRNAVADRGDERLPVISALGRPPHDQRGDRSDLPSQGSGQPAQERAVETLSRGRPRPVGGGCLDSGRPGSRGPPPGDGARWTSYTSCSRTCLSRWRPA